MRILVVGDTHGNGLFVRNYLYPTAICLGVDHILQVGDFGYWEHTADGVAYLDAVNHAATASRIPFYWLRGNHDKLSLLLDKYKRRTIEGFIPVREQVLFIPDGTSWMWDGGIVRPYSPDNATAVTARAFGGAYSVDKAWRLRTEQRNFEELVRREEYRRAAGRPHKDVPSTAGTLWFPEEEMTDDEMAQLLAADSDPRTVVFSHDKPRSSNPGIALKDIPECHFNQDRLQRALKAHRPQYWIHGHLHHLYTDRVRSGDDSTTAVIGLDCDSAAESWQKYLANPPDVRWRSWLVLDIDALGGVNVIFGDSALVEVDEHDFQDAVDRLAY